MENLETLPLATISVAFNLPALYFVVAIVIAIAAQLTLRKHRKKRVDRTLQTLSGNITEYFRKLGIDVSVSCFSLLEGKRFVAVIESEPIKKFRHSYIIEQALVRHVAKTTGQQVEKIYWRFPFQAAVEDPAKPAAPRPDLKDPYNAEGPAKAWAQAGYEVEDTSWESYTKAYQAAHPDETGPPKP